MFRRKAPLSESSEFPFQLPVRRIDRIEFSVVAPEINNASLHRWRRDYASVRLEFPFLRPDLQVDRVKTAVRAAHVRSAVNDRRRRNHVTIGVELPFNARQLRHAGGVIDASVAGS